MANDAAADERYWNYLDSPTVTLLVGVPPAAFKVHLAHLTAKSAFFTNAFKPAFAHAESETLSLPEDDKETVNLFVRWVYSDRLPTFPQDPAERDLCMARLFILADKWQVDELAQSLFREIYEIWKGADAQTAWWGDAHRLPQIDAVNLVFDSLPEGNILRRLMVHARVWRQITPSWEKVVDLLDNGHKDFLAEIMLTLWVLRQKQQQRVDSPCTMDAQKYWRRYREGNMAIADDVSYLCMMTPRRTNPNLQSKPKLMAPNLEGDAT